jgi:hypothetical protein
MHPLHELVQPKNGTIEFSQKFHQYNNACAYVYVKKLPKRKVSTLSSSYVGGDGLLK